MTRLQLQNLVLTWLSDPNAGYFSTSYVQQLLNNAQKEVQKQLLQANQNFYMVCATTAITSASAHYTLPTDFRVMHKLEVVIANLGTAQQESQVIAQATPMEIDMFSSEQGLPQACYLRKNSLTLAPWPDNNYTLKMLYSYMVQDMSADSSVPDVPDQYQEYVAIIATLDGLNQDGRDPSAFMMTKHDEYKALLKQDAQQRRQDGPRMVVVTESDASGWFF